MVVKPEARGELAVTDLASGALPRISSTDVALNTYLCGGRFLTVQRLGAGGMGVVYEAHDVERKTSVALKTLSRLDAVGVYELKNEFRALAGVRHPNIITLHELYADPDTNLWFFCMDLVHGVPFDEWVRDGDELRLRDAVGQLVDAVAAIHAAGKLHRDLKPSNVLVTDTGRVVVLDFGMASDLERGGVGQTVTDYRVHGTPSYMSPEQAAGERSTVASDYYSLGVMLFEVLTGELPFSGRFQDVLIDKQRRDASAPSQVVRRPIPNDLDALCMRLLSRDPAERTLAFEALSNGRPRSQPIVRVVSEAPRLFGRTRELEALRAAYLASCEGKKPVVVLLAGESGIGKSALVAAFLHEQRESQQAVILTGRCYECESVPFKGFDAVVDDLSRHLRRLTREQVNVLLPRDTSALRRLFPVLGRIPAIAEVPERELSDAQEERLRAFAAFGEILARVRDRRPLIIHLDDLQWSDEDSTRLLVHLLRQPEAPRFLLIASHRDEKLHAHPFLQPLYDQLPFDPRLDLRKLSLAALPDAAVHELLREHRADVPAEVTDGAAGNPFLLGELARHAKTHGATRRVSLLEVIHARAAALKEHERRVLELLAVAARPVPLRLIVDTTGAEHAPRSVLEQLQREHLARSTGDGDLVECYHDKIREALALSLSPELTSRYHRALADALSARPDADPEQLAGHLLGAGDPARAGECFVRAAERADRELGFERAARLYGQALVHGEHSDAERYRLKIARARVFAQAGRGEESAEVYVDASAGAPPKVAIELLQRAAQQYLLVGRFERGWKLLRQALTAAGIPVPGTTTGTLISLAYHDARLRLRNYRWLPRRRRPDPVTKQRFNMMLAASHAVIRLDPNRAAELAYRVALQAMRLGDEQSIGRALAQVTTVASLLGKSASEFDAIFAAAERVLKRSDDIAANRWWAYGRSFALLFGPRNEPERAIAHFDALIRVFHERRDVPQTSYDRAWAEMNRSLGHIGIGDFAAAARSAVQLEEAWHRNDLCVVPMLAGRVTALVGMASGDTTHAERELRRARAIWVTDTTTLQEQELCTGEWLLHAYAGRLHDAWKTADEWFERLQRSAMRSSNWFTPDAQLARGLFAAALAKTSDRAHWTRVAERVHRKSRLLLVRCALECLRGERAAAIATLREVESGRVTRTALAGQWLRIHEYAARRRLGELSGDAALIERADAFFSDGGVRDPQRFAAALLPGIEI